MIGKDVLGFSITPHSSRIMECNGYYAAIMRSDKKTEDDGKLPTGIPIPLLAVDHLKSHPDHWVGGEGSFVCPVQPDWGLWFNWSMNNSKRTAVLPSVKGMNPLTGMRTSNIQLETYGTCPVHNVKFKKNRLCPKCGFKWAPQNFISDPSPFYLDGFRTPDGNVRQFYFTEDMSKSIPEQVIGRDDTVPAFGFCFYDLKEGRTVHEDGKRLKGRDSVEFFKEVRGSQDFFMYGGAPKGGDPVSDFYLSGLKGSYDSSYEGSKRSVSSFCCSLSSDTKIAPSSASLGVSYGVGFEVSAKSLSSSSVHLGASYDVGVGAGAKIKQEIKKGGRPLTDWKETPEAVMRIYFVFQEEFERYALAGYNSLEGNKEGFLKDLPVGVENE